MSWKTSPLVNVTKILSGSTPESSNPAYWNGDHVWVTPTDLGKLGATVIATSSRLISEAGRASCNPPLIPQGAVVMSSRAPIGHLAIAGCALHTNQGCKSFVCTSELDAEFLYFTLKHRMADIQALGSGATFVEVSKSALEAFEISYPETIDEQHQIAARLKAQLAEVETARQAAHIQGKEMDALIAAVYRESFRSIVPVAEPKSVEAAPSGWAWHKLTDLARLESGHTPSRSRPEWWGGDISWVSLTEIRALDGQWVESTQIRTNEAGIANSSARLLPHGTVCFSRTASVGFVTILATPMATSQDFANWVCGEDLDPEYLMYALIRSRTELRAIATGATHKTIYMPALESFHLCAPPRPEQERIVSALKEKLKCFERIRTALKQQQSELTLLPKKILAQAFEN